MTPADPCCRLPGHGSVVRDPRAVFEGVRELQDAEVVACATDDLQPDRQPVAVKPHGTEIAGWPTIEMK